MVFGDTPCLMQAGDTVISNDTIYTVRLEQVRAAVRKFRNRLKRCSDDRTISGWRLDMKDTITKIASGDYDHNYGFIRLCYIQQTGDDMCPVLPW